MRKFEFVNKILNNEDGIKRLLPQRSTKNSAGYDFFNPKNITCKSHEITMIPTGIKAQFPEDEALLLFNRSSNPKKKGLIILNGVGVVDSDYYNNPDNEGEMAFVFYNMLEEDVTLLAGEKLGQGIFVKYAKTDDDTAEGERTGGFGSTGK
ncbi:dUTP diphosphatase [Intestinibacter sp.]|uniref:dUTP diphosphatase n=1 Tax=Intestinibacter sp. TaxID=1965304 RepID=UPI002A765ECE|nr:dUTP diphosphatase [Intestinibacter sp.]MDY2736230.1 dUTP diphosphatase [Intestinibacter sp.]